MKNIITILILATSLNAFACQNPIPESEAQRIIDAASEGHGVPPLWKCEDKPEEACLCPEIEGWNGEWKVLKVSDGKLIIDADKLAAHEAAKAQELAEKEAKKLERNEANDRLKAGCDVDLDSPSTIAGLKVKLKEMKACLRDILKSRE